MFLSWSGTASRQIAEILYGWIPRVLQAVEPFLSSQDIEKGERWLSSISTNLENIDVGIVVMTKSNIGAPWINFEAGALSKKIDRSRIIPVLSGISDTDLVNHPLAQFQYVKIEKDDMTRLFRMLNQSCPKPLPELQFEETFNLWFDKYFDQLQKIKTTPAEKKEQSAKSDPTEARLQRIESALDEILNFQRRARNTARLRNEHMLPDYWSSTNNDEEPSRLRLMLKGKEPFSTDKATKIGRDIAAVFDDVRILGIGSDGVTLDTEVRSTRALAILKIERLSKMLTEKWPDIELQSVNLP